MSLSDATPTIGYNFNSAFEDFNKNTQLIVPKIGNLISARLDRQYRINQCLNKILDIAFFLGKITEVVLICCVFTTSIPGITFAAVVLGIGICSPKILAYLTEFGLIHHTFTTGSPLSACAAIVLGIALYYFRSKKDELPHYCNPDQRNYLANFIATASLSQVFKEYGSDYITNYDLLPREITNRVNAYTTYQKLARLCNAYIELNNMRQRCLKSINDTIASRSAAILAIRQQASQEELEIQRQTKTALTDPSFNILSDFWYDLPHLQAEVKSSEELLQSFSETQKKVNEQEPGGPSRQGVHQHVQKRMDEATAKIKMVQDAQTRHKEILDKADIARQAVVNRSQHEETNYSRWHAWTRTQLQTIETTYQTNIAILNAHWETVKKTA